MPNSSDFIIRALSESAKIRVTYVDVTDSARTLEQRHLAGPTAGLVMAESLAAVALLSTDLSQPQETVSLHVQVDGPIGSVLVEASVEGHLRGYTQKKVLNELDGSDDITMADAMGNHATVQIIRSVPGKIISRATIEARPSSARQALDQYFNISMQTPTSVATCVESSDGYLDLARGLTVECMPDGDADLYEAVRELFADESIVDHLASAPSLAKLNKLLELPELRIDPPQPLMFGCRCNRQRVEAILAGLSLAELTELANQGKPQEITCHMCGDGYTIPPERIAELAAKKK